MAEPDFPHFSFRTCLFYFLWLMVSFGTMFDGTLDPHLAFWLSLIVLILIQVWDEVWGITHPKPGAKDEDAQAKETEKETE